MRAEEIRKGMRIVHPSSDEEWIVTAWRVNDGGDLDLVAAVEVEAIYCFGVPSRFSQWGGKDIPLLREAGRCIVGREGRIGKTHRLVIHRPASQDVDCSGCFFHTKEYPCPTVGDGCVPCMQYPYPYDDFIGVIFVLEEVTNA